MTEKFNLLVVTTTLPRFENDTEPRFVLDLSKHLQNWCNVIVLAPSDPEAVAAEILEGVRVERFRYAPLRRWETLCYPGAITPRLRMQKWMWLLVPFLCGGMLFAVWKTCRRERIDIIQCHWIIPSGLVQTILALLRLSPPFVVTSHGTDTLAFNSRLGRWLKQKVIEYSDGIVFVSSHLRARARELGLFKHQPLSIDTISMGVDIERFGALTNPAAPTETHQGTCVLLFVGRLSESKGVDRLLRALGHPCLAEFDIRLEIVGEGPERPGLEALALELGMSSVVSFLGARSHYELPDIYRSADIFCLPSVVAMSGESEGLPTVLCEAAASGLACVASDVGGVREIVENDVNGIIVAPDAPDDLARAVRKLVADRNLRERMGRAGRAKVADFSWMAIAKRYAEFMEDALSRAQEKA